MMLKAIAPTCSVSPLAPGAAGTELATALVSCAVAAVFAWSATALLNALKESSEKGSEPVEGDNEAGVRTSLIADTAAPRDARSDWVDSARFWLVGLVIACHAVGFPNIYLPTSKYFLTPLVVWAATFHIPGLVFVSGLCSRGPLRWTRLFTRLFAPYCISQFIQWAIFCKQNGKCHASLSGAEECIACLSVFPTLTSQDATLDSGLEWYLLSLIQWRIAAAGFSYLNLRPRTQLMLAFGIGIFTGYHPFPLSATIIVANTTLCYALSQRTASFFPFFVAGLFVEPNDVCYKISRMPNGKQAARVLFVGTLVLLCLHAHRGFSLSPLEIGAVGDFNYDYVNARPRPDVPGFMLYPPTCGLEQLGVGLIRAGRYVLSFIMVGAFLVATPTGPAWLCEAGRYTLYPYLLQLWPITFQQWFFQTHLWWGTWAVGQLDNFLPKCFWIGCFLSGFCFTYVATLPFVRRIFGFLIEPDWIAMIGASSRQKGKALK